MASHGKKRNRCAFRPCPPETDVATSFFSFPKDPERAAVWLKACNREDLLGMDLNKLNKHYQLCDKHFDKKLITKGGTLPRLFQNAYPTIFSHSTHTATDQKSSTSGNSERVTSEEFSVGSKVKGNPKTNKKDRMNKKIPSVVFSDTIKGNRRVQKPKIKEKESATTCESITTPPSIDSNISQNDSEIVTNEVGDTTAKELQDIKEESELYCRICFCVTTDFSSHIHIFPSNGENSCRQNKIQEMINQVMPDLDLSLTYNPGICIDCENRLISSYDFVSLSIQNQKTLMDYKCKHGDDTYVNIQDVVKTFDNTVNKRPLTDLTDVPSKKLKTLIPSNDQLEIKYEESDIQHQGITIKEELDCEYSNKLVKSTEVINNEAITEQSCNRLLSTSADKDNYCNLKYINVAVPTLKQITTSISEKSGEERNTSDEVQTYRKKLVELKSSNPVYYIVCRNTKDLSNNTEFEGTGMNVIQTNKLDTSNS